MPDGAYSDNPHVQAQLNRLNALSPGKDVLGLERIEALLNRLGRPQDSLPPVFHVAGTNGKGSTCAFLRAAIEASGLKVHVYSSPHLCRFNERIRLAGQLIDDDYLSQILSNVLDINNCNASFFEITTAAAFLAFSRIPADAAIIEVGLGGRLDATNILPHPAICGIASLGIDHEGFLLAPEANTPTFPLDRIAWEKAGIAKRECPLVISKYPFSMAQTVRKLAASVNAPLFERGIEWDATIYHDHLAYRDRNGILKLPLPRLAGEHQADNAALAVAMLRHQNAIAVPEAALSAAMGWAQWPARLQRLDDGPLTSHATNAEIWLDGGHNGDAARRIAEFLETWKQANPGATVHAVIGMLANKDAAAFLEFLIPQINGLVAVPVPGHDHHDPYDLVRHALRLGLTSAGVAPSTVSALDITPRSIGYAQGPTMILIAGSLYLAGEVLRVNDQLPD